MAAHCLARGLPRQVGLQVEHGGSGRTYGPRCAGPNVYRGTRRILRLSLWRGLAWFGLQHDKRSDATGDWCAHAAGKRTLQRTAGRLYLSSLPAHRRSDARRKLLSHPLVAFRLSHTLDRRVLPQWSAPRRLEHIPIEWKSACALDLFVIACPFRKTGFHPSGQARGHAFPGYALDHNPIALGRIIQTQIVIPAEKSWRSIVPAERARDEIGHFQIIGAAALGKSFRRAVLIQRFAVLIHFPLAFEPRNDEAETDNATHHRVDERVRRVGRCPRLGLISFLLRCQFGNVL